MCGDKALSGGILVVEDDPVSLMVIGQMLEIAGFSFDSASDGAEAVEMAARLRPALVLVDLSMPRINGLDVMRSVRASTGAACPKFVAVTALATERQRAECLSAGFDGFLAKPLEMGELLETVRGFMGGR